MVLLLFVVRCRRRVLVNVCACFLPCFCAFRFSLFAFPVLIAYRVRLFRRSSCFLSFVVGRRTTTRNKKQPGSGQLASPTFVCHNNNNNNNNNKALTRQGPDTHFQSYRTAPRLRRAPVQWSLTLPVYCCVHHAATTGITQHNDTTQQTARRDKQASREKTV